MNCLTDALVGKPSLISDTCRVCGRPANNNHHVIIKGMGGVSKETEKQIPKITLCGMGNTSGCHGLAHSRRLHFRFTDRWEFLITEKPMKYENALDMDGWHPCKYEED